MADFETRLQQTAESTAKNLQTAGFTVTAAESCTGGLVAAALTSVPGSSQWFEQSWVTYSNSAKQTMLGVPSAILEQYGAVSKEVVEAMATGALNRAGCTLAVAVSGIAGPSGGTTEKPVGTVWIAWALSDQVDDLVDDLVESRCFRFDGDRYTVRMLAAVEAIIGCDQRCRPAIG